MPTSLGITQMQQDMKELKREFLDKNLKCTDGATLDAVAHMLWEIESPNGVLGLRLDSLLKE